MNTEQYLLKIKRGLSFLNYQVQSRRYPVLAQRRQFLRALHYSRGAIRFFLDEGDSLLTECDLGPESLVFDVGGDVGNWAEAISRRYDPYIHIFEPNPNSYQSLRAKFTDLEKVAIEPFGLSDCNRTARLSLRGMGSSVFAESPRYESCAHHAEIDLRDIAEVVGAMEVDNIDLFKVNIEGSEFPLLLRMIETSLIEKCRIIRIQFHEWYPGAHRLRKEIRRQLARTHEVEWDYPFVWESWRRKD